MTTALEAVREELAALRPYVNRLEDAEALLDPAYPPTSPLATTPRNTKTKRMRKRLRHRNPTRSQVRDYIIAHAPLTRGEIVAALDGNPQAIDNKLRHLLADGEIGADGRPGARRYRSPDALTHPLTPAGSKQDKPSPPMRPDRGVYPLYDAIVDLGGATTEQLTGHTGLPTSSIVEQGRRLMQLGLVRFTGVGKTRMWLSTQSAIARDAA
jgi:hypothetical protein